MTIEEKAGEYAEKTEAKFGLDMHPKTASFQGYLAGHAEAMRWRDPKEELPDQTGLVLTKMGDDVNSVDICHFINGRFKLYYQNQPSDYTDKPIFREDLTDAIIGWRPIK